MKKASAKRRKNLFGFGKKVTVHKSRGQSRADVRKQAELAGRKSGDTGLFRTWARRFESWGKDALKEFEQAYRKGVSAGSARKDIGTFKGEKIFKLPTGDYETSLEKGSKFDSPAKAREFITAMKRNPNGLPVRDRTGLGIHHGDRVTIRTPHGQKVTGRAVMTSGDGRGWVLNLGGKYGTPGLAYPENIVKVSKRSGNPAPICYSQVNQGNWAQEHYESASGHARIRASALRKAGYKVTASSLGPQVTGVGVVRMTMLDIRPGKHQDTSDLPKVRCESLRTNPKGGKFDRCVKKVKKSGTAASPYAVCQKTVGRGNVASTTDREDYFVGERDKDSLYVVYGAITGKVKRRFSQRQDAYQFAKAHNLSVAGKSNPTATLTQGKATAQIYRKSLTGPKKFKVVITGTGLPYPVEQRLSSFKAAMLWARLKLHELAQEQRKNPEGGKYAVVDTAKGGKILKRFDERQDAYQWTKAKGMPGDPTRYRVETLTNSRKNPLDVAEKVYEEFHGEPSKEVLDYLEVEHYHSVTVGLGQLVCLDVQVNGKEFPLVSPGFSFDPPSHIQREKREKNDAWIYDPKTPVSKVIQLTSSEDGQQLFFKGGDQTIPYETLGLTDRDARDHMLIGTIVEVTYRGRKSFEGPEEKDFHHEFGKQGSGEVCPVLLYYPRSKTMKVAGGRYYIAPVRNDIGASPGIVG